MDKIQRRIAIKSSLREPDDGAILRLSLTGIDIDEKIQEIQDNIFNLILEARVEMEKHKKKIEELQTISELLEVIKNKK